MKIELKNPIHDGFYGSSVLNPSEEGNGVERSVMECDDNELDGYISDNDYEIYANYEEYFKEVTVEVNDYFLEVINDIISELFQIDDLFRNKTDDELVSPRYYNFETDKSYFQVEVNRYNYESFIDQVFRKYHQELKEMIITRHTSYDGFISFYSNNIDHWKERKYKLDYNELETIFKTLIKIAEVEEEIFYKLYDIASENFYNTRYWYESPEGEKVDYYELKKIVEESN